MRGAGPWGAPWKAIWPATPLDYDMKRNKHALRMQLKIYLLQQQT